MRIEAIVTKEDLTELLPHLAPLRVQLSGGGSLLVHEPTSIRLVAGVGLRFVCEAKLHWPLLGVMVPVTVHDVTVLVRPHMAREGEDDLLVFPVEIERADFAPVPEILDAAVTARVNTALAKNHVQASWAFRRTLSHVFTLPAALEQLRGIALKATAGEVRIFEDGISLTVSLHAAAVRALDAADAPAPGARSAEPEDAHRGQVNA